MEEKNMQGGTVDPSMPESAQQPNHQKDHHLDLPDAHKQQK